MRSSRVSTETPSLCTVDVRSESRDGLAAFPTPALPGFGPPDWTSGFGGTMQPSDSLRVICLPCLFSLSGILESSMIGIHSTIKNLRVSLVALMTAAPIEQAVYSASGRATPGLFSQLAGNAARSVAFGYAQTVGRIQQIQNFGAHAVHRRVATPGRFTLTTFLCTLQDTTSKSPSYAHPATLDTEHVANAYPGGILTR